MSKCRCTSWTLSQGWLHLKVRTQEIKQSCLRKLLFNYLNYLWINLCQRQTIRYFAREGKSIWRVFWGRIFFFTQCPFPFFHCTTQLFFAVESARTFPRDMSTGSKWPLSLQTDLQVTASNIHMVWQLDYIFCNPLTIVQFISRLSNDIQLG